MVTYEARGEVCGGCGHGHRTLATARMCADRHHRSIRAAYPSTYPTRAYSDRIVVRSDGGRLSDAEMAELEAAEEDALSRDEVLGHDTYSDIPL